MKVQAKKQGFTLTEILIVLVIAGVLLALILPNSVKAINKGNAVASSANIQSCEAAVAMCYGETKLMTSCDAVAELTAGGYTKSDIVGITAISAQGVCS
jgi:prepilin-type N-terminal cleavage/methylation domain-containing protein